MQAALTEDEKIKVGIDVGNAIIHLMNTIRRAGEFESVFIYKDGQAQIHMADKRAVIDNCMGDLDVRPRDYADLPWAYRKEFNGTLYYAHDSGGEE